MERVSQYDMKNFFYGFQKKLLLYSILLVFTMILFFLVVVARIIGNERKVMENQYLSVTEKMASDFDVFFTRIEDMTDEIIMDTYIQECMKLDTLSVNERESLERVLSFKANEHVSYYFYIKDKRMIFSNRNVTLNQAGFENSFLNKTLMEDYAKLHLIWSDESILGVEGSHLYAGRNIRSITYDQKVDQMYFLITEETMKGLLSVGSGLDEIYLLFSDTGQICCSASGLGEQIDEKLLEKIAVMLSDNAQKENSDMVYRIQSSLGVLYVGRHARSGFCVATFIPNGSMGNGMWQSLKWILFIMIVDLVVAVGISVFFSNRFSAPVRKVSDAMSGFDDESLEQKIVISTNTELDEIGSAYNTMLDRIKNLMEQVRRKEKELKEQELETLLYQIHPHFLYNTLGNIYMLARIHKQEQIMVMVDSLSKYLRVTLSNGYDIITVEQELVHVRAYMEIQRIRNSELFDYTIESDPGVEAYHVAKLFLQPIVENSIKHGFIEITEGGRIRISVKEIQDKLVVEVYDNGCGMDEATLERMNRLLETGQMDREKSSASVSGGYGIGNVVRRLKLSYGEGVHLFYQNEDQGLTCCIEFDKELLEQKWNERRQFKEKPYEA